MYMHNNLEDESRLEFVSGLRDFYETFPELNLVEEEEIFEVSEETTFVEVTSENVDEICQWIQAYLRYTEQTGNKPFLMGYREEGLKLFLVL